MQDFRKMAAAMDQRMRQLEKEGVTGGKVLDRMMGHLPDLQRIWEGAKNQQVAMLCEEYAGGDTRNWTPIVEVHLNSHRQQDKAAQVFST